MNREEFLQGLTKALTGEVPPEIVRENLRYYEEYIRAELKKGRSENEIMEELGSPRLIARTIIDTTPGGGGGVYEEERFDGHADQGRSDSGVFSGAGRMDRGYQQSGGIHYYDLNKWYWKLLGLMIVIVTITLVLMVIGGILSLVIPLLPVIAFAVLIMWLLRGGFGQ
mgnify:CR=1 FL=1